ncbi:hypothetical protein BH23ACT7_BH23ACT7_17930 [soil metagenome]
MTRRTTVEVDDELLERAEEALGTRGLKDTVDRALGEVVRAWHRKRLAEGLRAGTAFDFENAPIDRTAQWRTDLSSQRTPARGTGRIARR